MWLTHFSLVLILCFLELAIGFFGWTTAPEQLASFNKRYSLKVEHSPWQFTIPAGKLFFKPSFLRGYVKLPGCRFLEDKSKCFLSECPLFATFQGEKRTKATKFLHRSPWVSVFKKQKSQFDFVKAVFFSGRKNSKWWTPAWDGLPGLGFQWLITIVIRVSPQLLGLFWTHPWPWKWRTKMGLGYISTASKLWDDPPSTLDLDPQQVDNLQVLLVLAWQ